MCGIEVHVDIDWVRHGGNRVLSQHNDEQFHHLFTTHRDAVWSYVVRRVDRNDVDDAVAEVFVVAWRKVAQVPERAEVLPWLYGIARNVVRNTQRSSKRRQRLWTKNASLARKNSPSPDIQVVRDLDDAALLAAVAALHPFDRELLRLRTWEELSIKDIALVVGKSPKSVESRLVRIRKNLARTLDVPESPLHAVRPVQTRQGGEQ
jgi:RNA polymerase sigma-70 factor, ECF subfamily